MDEEPGAEWDALMGEGETNDDRRQPAGAGDEADPEGANVIALDTFRKK
jgi:hypothetical protein